MAILDHFLYRNGISTKLPLKSRGISRKWSLKHLYTLAECEFYKIRTKYLFNGNDLLYPWMFYDFRNSVARSFFMGACSKVKSVKLQGMLKIVWGFALVRSQTLIYSSYSVLFTKCSVGSYFISILFSFWKNFTDFEFLKKYQLRERLIIWFTEIILVISMNILSEL